MPDAAGPEEGTGRLRLAVIVSTYTPNSRFIEREFEALRRHGVDLSIFSLRHHPEAPSQSATVLPYLLSWEVWSAMIGWTVTSPLRTLRALGRVVGHHLRSPRVLIKSLASFPKTCAYARRIRRGGFARIHAHWAGVGATAAYVAHVLTGLPFSFTGHAWDLYFDTEMLAEKVRRADFVVTCTARNQDMLRQRYPWVDPSRIRVCHHGIDFGRYAFREPRRPGPAPVILGVGRRTTKKGFEDVVRAAALLRQRGKDVRVRIVGPPGDADPSLEALIHELCLRDAVHVDGFMEEEDLLAVYRDADVLAVASVVTADGKMDGLPNVTLEAMALGVPVVASDVSGIPEAIRDGETGLVVPPQAPEALANAIERALDDHPATCERTIRARREAEAKFDATRNAQNLLSWLSGGAPQAGTGGGSTRRAGGGN